MIAPRSKLHDIVVTFYSESSRTLAGYREHRRNRPNPDQNVTLVQPSSQAYRLTLTLHKGDRHQNQCWGNRTQATKHNNTCGLLVGLVGTNQQGLNLAWVRYL
jgi:hypothetical protein